jgi:hypothetical protein
MKDPVIISQLESENAHLRVLLQQLHEAVAARMMAEEPAGEERRALVAAWSAVGDFLLGAGDLGANYTLFGFLAWQLVKGYGNDFCGDEWSEQILPLAAQAGLCRRVVYDPDKHGDIEADPGTEIWFWGEEVSNG